MKPLTLLVLVLAGVLAGGCSNTTQVTRNSRDLGKLPPEEYAGTVYELEQTRPRPQRLQVERYQPLPSAPADRKFKAEIPITVWYRDPCTGYRSVATGYHSVFVNVTKPGEMEISFVVDERGKVAAIKVISATHPEYATKVCHKIASWDFLPGEKDGVAVATRMVHRLKYGYSQ